jgi:murein DD-endopeptidase MepM/ murein hydrolase activator NlpD
LKRWSDAGIGTGGRVLQLWGTSPAEWACLVAPVERSDWGVLSVKKLFVLLFLGGLGWGVYRLLVGGGLTVVLDRTPPVVAFSGEIAGVGMEPVKIPVTLTDAGSGVSTVRVMVVQNGESREVLTRVFAVPRDEEVVEIDFAPRALGLKEGEAEVVVQSGDNSVWESSGSGTIKVLVDYARPRMEVLSLQHVAVAGGAEFVVYRATDTNMRNSGVRVGAIEFPGLPLSDFDSSASVEPGLFVALFALPLEMTTAERVQAFARDNAGNETLVPVNFRIDLGKPTEVTSKLTKPFLEAKMPELMDKFIVASGKEEKPDYTSTDGLMASFRFVNEDYRHLLNAKLKVLFEAPLTPRLWTKEVFLRPMPAATSSIFGEHRNYALDGTPVSQSMHNGVDLASTGNAPVMAVQDGTIVMAEDHGIYGNTIVVDHGAGLFSLYGHLASMLVSTGEAVKRGVTIGRTGTTGLAGGDHLHFEFRVRNVPVNPIEWWDPKWLIDNIEGKIDGVRAVAPAGNPT